MVTIWEVIYPTRNHIYFMIWEIAGLMIGLLVLIKASELTIKNAIKLSKLTGLSEALVGFVFIAFATSFPELAVTVISAANGDSSLGISMLMGSNIADMVLVMGCMALLASFKLLEKDIAMLEKALFITTVVALFSLVLGSTGLALGIFSLAMFYMFFKFFMKKYYIQEVESGIKTLDIIKAVLWVALGIAFIILSADLVTKSSLLLASFLDVTFIGAIIVALGTSLPELAVSIAAVRRMDIELAIGNMAGSLVFNLTFIFGLASILAPTVYMLSLSIAVLSLVITNIIFYVLIKRNKFSMGEGFLLLFIYFIFVLMMIYGI